MSLSDHQAKLLEIFAKLPQKKIAQVIILLIIIYIAFLVAQISWLLAPKSALTNNTMAGHYAPIKSSASTIDISAIQALNLFGRYSEQITETNFEVKDAPETQLNLTLTGVVASTEKAIGAAIIENNGKQNTYGIGDIITSTRATLAQVMRDRVLIKQSGRLETLMLDGFKYQKAAQANHVRRINKAKPLSPRSSGLRASPHRAIDQRKNKALTEKMTRLKRDLASNPSKITDYLKISPMRRQGKIYGYRLMPSKDKEFFKAAGLKTGDIATQLNGFELSQPSQAALALKALREDTQVSLTIDRHGEIKQILFSIN
ncbi:MAG: type II secretion system protein GspC [Alteromonadaceae bacterium]|nr:type II secretion system protein GspC [Alteromonadaceae bacterium]